MFDRILIVCDGNICRSPMAQVLLQARLHARGLEAEVRSAGLSALVGHAAHPVCQALMAERRLDLSAHRARQLTPELLAGSDLVLVMEARQAAEVERISPVMRGRVQRLGRFGGFDVPDPFQRPRAAYEAALALIERGLDAFEAAFWR